MTEAWKKWEGQVVNGNFPLRQYLGGSEHSAVFLTEHRVRQLPNAAIKLVPADPATAELQLSRWRSAAALSHPHLMRLLEMGRCQLYGRQLLFVVMEYAEENLAQILPQRPLTPAEAKDMLEPTLDVLAYLHGKNLVQGQLKPPNFLVVNDQLKIASDTIRPAGESPGNIAAHSIYDPPEAKNGRSSPAGDVWALGATLVETLTQHPPEWPHKQSEGPSLPANMPAAFANIGRQCLRRDPQSRVTVAELTRQIKQPAPVPASSTVPAVSEQARKPRWLVPAVVGVLILVAIFLGVRLFSGGSDKAEVKPSPAGSSTPGTSLPGTAAPSSPPVSSHVKNPERSTSGKSAATTEPAEEPAARPSSPANVDPASRSNSSKGSEGVVHEEIPNVPKSARNTIHGRIKVSVRVQADGSGDVVDEELENAGPSKYFAHLALEAAKKWKFAPTGAENAREWIVRFEFTKGGTSGHAVGGRS